jgi:hypothetical protein
MRSEFEPKHLQRAKETLHRQLELVHDEIVKQKQMQKESRRKPSLWKRISRFLSDLF